MLMTMRSNNNRNTDLERLFSLSPEAVAALRDGRIVYANAAAERLFSGQIVGQSMVRLLPDLEIALPEERYVTAAALKGQDCAVTAVRWDGLLILTFRPMREYSAAVGDAMLSRLRSEAFSLRFSLERTVTPEVQADPRGQMLFHSYYRLLHLIDQLSDVSALAKGEMICRMQPLDLNALLSRLWDSVRFFTEDRRAEILCSLPEDPCVVNGSPERLEQLLLILISNALIHTAPGGHIRLGLQPSGSRYLISVDDDGPGMSAQSLSGAFSPKEDVDLSDPGGAGMGLHIAYGIARLHSGTIVLHSKPGEGTHVRLTLPCAADKLGVRDSGVSPAAGADQILTELADVLSDGSYHPRYRD